MPMSLRDLGLAIGFDRSRALSEHARIGTEAHRAAFGRNRTLLIHESDHRILGLRVDFGRIRPRHPANAARELDHGELHAEADPEKWHPPLTRVANGRDLSLGAAGSKSGRHQDAI